MPLGFWRRLGVALVALTWMGAAAAQERPGDGWASLADPIFQNLNQAQGLPSSVYNAIAEDADGFLWFGGGKALYRWDGYRFHGYGAEPGNPSALQDNYILCLHKDPQGRLWIGTSAGGLARYDRATDGFVTIAAGEGGLANGSIDAIADDGEGGLWIGTEGGLDHLDKTGRITHLHHYDDDPASLPDDRITRLWLDKTGHLWVGTRGGLARLSHGHSDFQRLTLPSPATPRPTIWALMGDEAGRVWVGTLGQGAYVYSAEAGDPRAEPIAGLGADSVGGFAEAVPGRIWIGTFGQGIVDYDPKTGAMRRLNHDPSRQTSLADDTIHTLYHDHMGAIWAGVTGTVSRIDPGQDALLTLFGGTNHEGGLSDGEAWSILSAGDGRVWVGQRTQGIDILDPAQGRRVGALRPDPAHPDSALPAAPVYALASAEGGAIYIATLRGLYRADQAGGKVRRLTVNPDSPQMGTRTLAVTGRTLWIGCTGNGLWRFDLDSEKSVRHYGIAELGDARVETVRPGLDGLLWVGTENGLALLDPTTDKVERIQPDPARADSLPAKWISALLLDSRGRQWVGTLGGGLSLFEGRDEAGRPRFRRIGAQAGLAHAIIGGLFEDQSGHVWASSDEGISLIDPDSFSVRLLQRAEGASLSLFRVGAAAATPSGEILFGGVGGLAVVRPERVKPQDYLPPLVLSDLRIGGQAAPPGAALTLTPERNAFQAEFAALDFSAPERIQYAYRLDGIDKDWIASDPAHRLAAYSNLPPGKFMLRVRASTRDGVWMEKTLDLPVRVKAAWYQTIWFKLAAGLLALAGIAALIASRTAYLRARQKRLEQMIAERTASLAEANEALGKRGEELERKTRQVTDLLDNSGEGFFSFDGSLLVGEEYSRACEAMLGGSPAGRLADQVLLPGDSQKAKTFRQIVSTALAADTPWKRSMMLSLLPHEFERGGARLRADYKDLGDDRVMVVLKDVTEERHLARKVETEHRHLAMTVAVVAESRDFFDLIASVRRFWNVELKDLLDSSTSPTVVLQELYRRIHTLKGSLSQFHFADASSVLNELENDLGNLRYRGDELMADEISSLVAMVDGKSLLDTDLAPLRQVLGEEFFEGGNQLKLSADRVRSMLTVAERLQEIELPETAQADVKRLTAELRQLLRVNLAEALGGFERVIRQTAKQLDKAIAPLEVDCPPEIWIDPDRYGAFLHSLTHVFRNAATHGIEDPEERLVARKPLDGLISARIERDGGSLRLTISDDGAGIDLEALRAKAVELGFHTAEQAAALPEDKLIDLIFTDAFTTRAPHPDGIAGRGVGLAAVRAEVAALGGTVSVRSRTAQGTSFLFTLPDDQPDLPLA